MKLKKILKPCLRLYLRRSTFIGVNHENVLISRLY